MLLRILFLLSGFSLLYTLLWWVVPRGNLLHELLHLPPFWWRLLSSPTRGLREERIRYGDHSRQYLLFCHPARHVKARPHIIIYFHGGGWQFGAPEQFRAHAWQLTQMGFAVVLPSYRRAPRHNYRHMREDLTRILLKTREVLSDRAMSEKRAVIGGMSAGGNLAALAALDQKALKTAGIAPDWVEGLFLFGAPLHLEKMADSLTLRNFAGPRGEPMFRKASPFNYLDKPITIPTLILHGTHDGMVEFEGVREFAERMKAANNAETHFVVLPEGTHLDVAGWFFREGRARQAFKEWLEGLK